MMNKDEKVVLNDYRGFDATVKYSEEDSIHFGTLNEIKSTVSFEGESIEELQKNFEEAVDSYISFCERRGIQLHASKEESPSDGDLYMDRNSDSIKLEEIKTQEKIKVNPKDIWNSI